MKTVTRKIVSKPSNSKSPGGTHHIEIATDRSHSFATTAELRGTGWGQCDIDADEAVIEVAATYLVGKGGKKERVKTIRKVRVTGNQDDTITLAAEYTSSQSLVVEFRGVCDLAD